jgi:hypothetical protein
MAGTSPAMTMERVIFKGRWYYRAGSAINRAMNC